MPTLNLTPRESAALLAGATVLARPAGAQPKCPCEGDYCTDPKCDWPELTENPFGASPGDVLNGKYRSHDASLGLMTTKWHRLRVKRVWCQRVQDADDHVCSRMGFVGWYLPATVYNGEITGPDGVNPCEEFPAAWNTDNPDHPFDQNPWAWFAEVERIEKGSE